MANDVAVAIKTIKEAYNDTTNREAYSIVKERYGDKSLALASDVNYKILALLILESEKQIKSDIKSRVTSPVKRDIRQAKRDNNSELVGILERLLTDVDKRLDIVLSDIDVSTYKESPMTLEEIIDSINKAR